MRAIISLSILLLLSATALAQNKIEGWGKAKFGMSTAQLQKAFPEAKTVERQKIGHLYTELIIDKVVIDEAKFQVKFVMNGTTDELDRVNIEFVDESMLKNKTTGNYLKSKLTKYVQDELGFGPGADRSDDVQDLTEWFFEGDRIIRTSYLHYESSGFEMYSVGCVFLGNGDDD